EPPSIMVDPPALYAEVHLGGTEEMTLNVGNTGGEDLTYDIVESPAVDWFSVDQTSGSVGGQGSQAVTGTFSTAGMETGFYQTTLLVNSNDPQTPQLAVDVEMEVYNTPPTIALPESIAIGSGYVTAVDLSSRVHDSDGDPLTLSCSGNVHISVHFSGLTAYFTPREDFSGLELITFTVSDGYDEAFDATVVYVDPDLLAIPEISIAYNGQDTLRIEWDGVPNALSYDVWGCSSPHGAYVLLGSTSEAYWDFAVPGEARHFFRVVATDSPVSR
ncbi:MAG: BACON domain-containing protein, partial [Candidatus Syntrophosphaera sp.]